MKITNYKLQITKLLVVVAVIGAAMPAKAFWPFTKKKVETSISDKRSYDQTSENIASVVEGEKTPAPNITVTGGTNNTVDLNLNTNPSYRAGHNANVQASGSAAATLDLASSVKTALPWSIAALLLIGAGFLALKLYKAAKAEFPAVGAAFNLADEAFGRYVGKLESHLQSSNDPTEKAKILQWLNEANKERGIVASSAPPSK